MNPDVAQQLLRAIERAAERFDEDYRIFTSAESRSWTRAQQAGARYAFATAAINLGVFEGPIEQAVKRLSPDLQTDRTQKGASDVEST